MNKINVSFLSLFLFSLVSLSCLYVFSSFRFVSIFAYILYLYIYTFYYALSNIWCSNFLFLLMFCLLHSLANTHNFSFFSHSSTTTASAGSLLLWSSSSALMYTSIYTLIRPWFLCFIHFYLLCAKELLIIHNFPR